MLRKLIWLLLLVFLVTMLFIGTSCKSEAAQTSEEEATAEEAIEEEAVEEEAVEEEAVESLEKITVGVIIAGSEATYFAPYVDAAKAEAEKQNVELIVLDSSYTKNKEVDNANILISREVDVAVITPIDYEGVITTLEALKEAGIYVIDALDRQAEEGDQYVDIHIGFSPFDCGKLCGEYLVEALDNEGKILIVEGFPGSPPQIKNTNGFMEGIEGSGLEVIGQQGTDWSREQAMTVMEDFLTRFPEIDGVFAHDDNLAVGVIQASKAAGRLGEFKIASIGGNKDGLEAVKNGELDFTVYNVPDWEGQNIILASVALVEGDFEEWVKESIDPDLVVYEDQLTWIKSPINSVTIDNADQFEPKW